ncbi:hypothetical protein PybrP1_001091 [[Pythium] brassicae (nom. inval.)]|nr:hypothetical protein PybrP1_001091 [[Pythium] brassicae (nom. inval.)]
MAQRISESGAIDLGLLVSQRRVCLVREALENDPSLLRRWRWSGQHPLHRAAAAGDTEMVSLLLRFGADANERAAWGWYSPLHLACKHGHERVIWLLLNHGAKWSVTDKAKRTPLEWATRAGKASIAYRVDQQLHAREKAAKAEALLTRTQRDPATPLTFASFGL